LEEVALAVLLLDAHAPARHVNRAAVRVADAIERTDQVGAGFLGAANQRVQPAGRHEKVVVEKHDVAARRARETQVACLVGTQKAVGADELEAPGLRLPSEVSRGIRRRSSVDVDEAQTGRRVAVDRFEGAGRGTESLTRHDDESHLRRIGRRRFRFSGSGRAHGLAALAPSARAGTALTGSGCRWFTRTERTAARRASEKNLEPHGSRTGAPTTPAHAP